VDLNEINVFIEMLGDYWLKQDKSILKTSDKFISKTYTKIFKEKKALIIPFFHILFKNENEVDKNHVDPETGILVDKFKEIVEFFLEKNYIFIKPSNQISGLDKNKNYIMLTFDDGYYNNIYSLKILKKYNIPATFFISTYNIEKKQSFWWDVLYREMKKQNFSRREIRKEQEKYKRFKTEIIIQKLQEKYSKDSFIPKSNIDRPFLPNELRDFAKENLVVLGNHTHYHSILTNNSIDEVKNEISKSQSYLEKLTGELPKIISYPNGNYSNDILKIINDTEIKLGLTVEPRKNYHSNLAVKEEKLKLGRFFVGNWTNTREKCEMIISDFNFHRKIFYKFNKSY
jgi:peptidoglycan/xylan/chitin deacetylase (PgdA/CDA1 family)